MWKSCENMQMIGDSVPSTDVLGTEEMVSVMVTRGGDGGGAPATRCHHNIAQWATMSSQAR